MDNSEVIHRLKLSTELYTDYPQSYPQGLHSISTCLVARFNLTKPKIYDRLLNKEPIMVMVINPFFSAWASGTVGKLITCRAMFNQRFCMHRHRHTQQKRSPAQIEMQEMGTRKVKIALWFWKVAEWRSARLRMNRLGLTILGSPEGLIRPLATIPPAGIEKGA